MRLQLSTAILLYASFISCGGSGVAASPPVSPSIQQLPRLTTRPPVRLTPPNFSRPRWSRQVCHYCRSSVAGLVCIGRDERYHQQRQGQHQRYGDLPKCGVLVGNCDGERCHRVTSEDFLSYGDADVQLSLYSGFHRPAAEPPGNFFKNTLHHFQCNLPILVEQSLSEQTESNRFASTLHHCRCNLDKLSD